MIAQAVVVSFVLALILLMLLLSRAASGLALDHPNERSLHERPVPRTGGIALLAGALVAGGLAAPALWLPLALAGALGALSLVDDLLDLPAALRLAAHLAAAALLVWQLAGEQPLAALVVLVLAIAWITNLYNFMDGADGLAAGMAISGFGTYALAAGLAGASDLAAASAALAAAAAAFLVYNFPPARIFLGDVGSIPLGFLAGALGLAGWRADAWPLWFPLLAFAPFIGDATLTLARRLARRERVWQAHREHYYQRLVRMGFGHRGTAWITYAAMLACGATALAARTQPAWLQAALFAGATALLLALGLWIDRRWARQQRAGGAS